MERKIKEICLELGIKIENLILIKTFQNIVYKISSKQKNYYIKIYTSKDEKTTAFKLSKIYYQLYKKGVLVPKVIKFSYIDSLPYLVLSEIKGDMLKDKINSFSKQEGLNFYSQLGEQVAKIHAFTFSDFGEFDGKRVTEFNEANDNGPFTNWKYMHNEIISYRLSFLKNTDFEDLIVRFENYFRNNSYLIDYNITPRLLHIDLNQKNILVNEENKISGIIDFDGAFVGHNEEELMRIENANFKYKSVEYNAFFENYSKIISLDEGYEKRRNFYYLSRLLVHINCIILYGTNYIKDLKFEEEKIRKEIEEIINL